MKQVFVTFLILLFSMNVYCQKVDTIQLNKLLNKSVEFRNQNQLDSAITYANELSKKASVLKDSSYILKSYDKLAQYLRLQNSIFESVKYYSKSKELNLILKDTSKAIDKLIYIASLQKRLGDFNSSENTAIEALKLTEYLPDSLSNSRKIMLYNNLGITSNGQHNYEDAYKWYKDALKLNKKTTSTITLKNNLALTLIKLDNYKDAADSLYKLLGTQEVRENPKTQARILSNLGFARSKLDKKRGKQELLKALQMRQSINDFSGQFASYIHLTEYFLDRQDSLTALNYARQALATADTLQSATSRIEALSYLIRLEENPKKSANQYYRLKDSITTARQQAKNQFAKIKYETEENRKTILQLENEKARQALIIENRKIEIRLFVSLIVIVVITTVFLYLYLRTKHRKEKLKEIYKTEKRLARKIHDELANDVYQVMTLLETQQNIADPDTLDKLEDIYERTRNISRDNSSIATGKNYADELKQMLSRYGTNMTNIIINGLHSELWKNVPAYKKVELYRALQELMTNMRKHSKATLVAITFRKEAKTIQINYSDNGIGLQKSTHIIPNGLQNVENRISGIKGLTTFDKTSERGLKIFLSFPV